MAILLRHEPPTTAAGSDKLLLARDAEVSDADLRYVDALTGAPLAPAQVAQVNAALATNSNIIVRQAVLAPPRAAVPFDIPPADIDTVPVAQSSQIWGDVPLAPLPSVPSPSGLRTISFALFLWWVGLAVTWRRWRRPDRASAPQRDGQFA